MKRTIHEISSDIPVLGEYDVVVCGGGPAGIAAALAAQRLGARVLLLERMSQCGGMGTTGLVCHWLGGRTGDTQRWVVGGIFRELVEQAVREGIAVLPRAEDYADMPYTPYGQYKGIILAGVPYDPFAMTCLIERTLREAGVEIMLQCQVIDATREGDRIGTITVVGKNGLFAVRATHFVDATGDADLAARAGCEYMQGDDNDGDIAGVSFMLQIENADDQRFMDAIIAEDDPRQRQRIQVLRERDEFPYPMDILIFVKLNRPGRYMINGNWAPAEDATDPRWRSQAILDIRGRIPHLLELFHRYFPGLENCTLRAFASDLGVRETRRINGIRRLTVAELQRGTASDDTIGLSAYGWDLGGSKNIGQPMHGQPKPELTAIPYGIMVPRDCANLVCPGRAISVERQVLGPLRVMAPVMAMGQASGTAAAIAAANALDFAAISIDPLQKQLRQDGALLSGENLPLVAS